MLKKFKTTSRVRTRVSISRLILGLVLCCAMGVVHGQSDNDLQAAQMMNVDSINMTAGTIVLNGEVYRLALQDNKAASSNYRWSSDNSAALRHLRPGDTVMVSFDSDGAKVVRLQKIESITPPDNYR